MKHARALIALARESDASSARRGTILAEEQQLERPRINGAAIMVKIVDLDCCTQLSVV
jgi:hypothetical protein